MAKNPGIIYDLGDGRYGLALDKEQVPALKIHGKVFMRVYTDILCTIKRTEPETGRQYTSVKHITQLRQIGYQD